MFSLAGKTAVVTGGGGGLGRGMAMALAQAGAAVAVAGRRSEALEATVAAIRDAGGKAAALACDITQPGAAAGLIDSAVAELGGRLDIWVNNAGSAAPADVGRLIGLSEDQWDRVVDLNLKWSFFAAQAAARAMGGDGKGGSIINLSSRSGSQPNPLTGQYGAAKAGIESLTATMAVEWGHLGIRVNAIAPGVVVTEANADRMSGPRAQKQIDSVPMGRLGVPGDVAGLCVYLASDEAAWVSGTVIPVNGGSRVAVAYMAYLHQIAKENAQ
ncbi:glucose 1-dehydrogenase [Frigidibacter albus]|uniref:Glucose 1-dehydrogenase n=1 Tax=Frigidibacter albus TaxID=1465486 RepID=A0A6L8VL63_9RHOB|nr:SDR family NAD(P)-dependent oxidoreductase [Frigidibacter albus]MZQ91098.1 glucose 1-dehydrogenase [Frigidibacter albus]NBE32983.1 glucose 1-dehydrogenase [Frigidibacter albus]GGH62774.1 2-deoxy-D-gluconate 3-dehydrogenase [Frigidibacter albus]